MDPIPGMALLDHMATVFNFLRKLHTVSTVAAPTHSPPNSVRGFPFLCTLSSPSSPCCKHTQPCPVPGDSHVVNLDGAEAASFLYKTRDSAHHLTGAENDYSRACYNIGSIFLRIRKPFNWFHFLNPLFFFSYLMLFLFFSSKSLTGIW